MPPRITSTWSCSTSFAALAAATRVVGRAVLEDRVELAAQQAALGVDVADDHPGDVGVGEPDERQGAGLVRDDSDLDRCVALRHAVMTSSFVTRSRLERSSIAAVGVIRMLPPSARAVTSGELPILATPLRLGELVATLALAQDNAFGQPLESQLRSCLLATWMCEAADFDDDVRDTVYWVALLRYIGCTGHAHEVATLFGDEIAIRAADARA